MEIRKLTLQEIREVYHTRLVHDFPANERIPLKYIEKVHAQGGYDCYGAFENDALAAYAILRKNGDVLLVYYAVSADQRGTGIGSRFLPPVCAFYDVPVWAEVEDPEMAKDEADKTIRTRRIAFYERLGFQTAPVGLKYLGVTYNMIALPLPQQSPEELIARLRKMYKFLPLSIRLTLRIWKK